MYEKNRGKKVAWLVAKNYHTSLSRIYKESQSLSNNGYWVKIFSIRTNYRLPEYEEDNNVVVNRISIPWIKKFFPDGKVNKIIIVLWTIKVLRILTKYSPDIVYCSNLYTSHIGYLIRKFRRTPFIYDSHDLFIDQTNRYKDPHFIRLLKMKYEKFISNHASIIIQTTKSRANRFEEYYGIKPKIIMNKPMANVGDCDLPDTFQSIIKSGKKIIGYIGSIHDNRGLEQMVEATKNMDNLVIVMLGYATSPWAKNFINNNRKDIVWIPPVPPHEITAVAKYFTLGLTLIQKKGLSYYYSCPAKLFEFVVSGVPQISSNFPEISDLLINNTIGPLGRVVDPGSVAEIKKAISELLSSPEELEIYRNNCVEIINQCTWESQEEKFLRIIDSVAY